MTKPRLDASKRDDNHDNHDIPSLGLALPDVEQSDAKPPEPGPCYWLAVDDIPTISSPYSTRVSASVPSPLPEWTCHGVYHDGRLQFDARHTGMLLQGEPLTWLGHDDLC
ncbi:hypothetical protein AJ79_02161 [Helicocarpus griseus UAMH5409]|uniref:Uncharacterized protein n=1 Tax=Helicocarpus griseus UAMH5409 TaxID=1447875 RepID=A0A2B7Y412_9EURO|nr:hypothetical protein AJ79_02161 [Helicocarpus griseus UAMH5409]